MNLEIKSIDMHGEKYLEVLKTEKIEKLKGYYYIYNDQYGESKIYILNNKIKIFRKGQIISELNLDETKQTKFNYNTQFINKIFNVKTKKISINIKKIFIEYEIYDSDELINRISMTFIERGDEI